MVSRLPPRAAEISASNKCGGGHELPVADRPACAWSTAFADQQCSHRRPNGLRHMPPVREPDEFLSGAAEWPEGLSRRRFLQLMGASIALAGATGCTRNPLEHIVP